MVIELELEGEENEEEKRTTAEGKEIVACPHCGADTMWEACEAGWILVDVGTEDLDIEDAIHYCPSHPGAIEFDDETEEE